MRVALIICLFLSACNSRQEPPSLGGQDVPQKVFQIDFDKRYKVICSGYQARKDAVVYDNVSILGFVGTDEANRTRGSSYSYGYFNHWLVLELQDKRKVYLPSSSISIIEEVESK